MCRVILKKLGIVETLGVERWQEEWSDFLARFRFSLLPCVCT